MELAGYQLVYLVDEEDVKTVAGFHVGESFGWGKYLYIDDLVTDAQCRSQGFGEKLVTWLCNYAREHACAQIHLDSRVTRFATHKFYLNKDFYIGGHHFLRHINDVDSP